MWIRMLHSRIVCEHDLSRTCEHELRWNQIWDEKSVYGLT